MKDKMNKVKNAFFGRKIVSALYMFALFWFLLGYVIIPIFSTLQETVASGDGVSLNVIVDYLKNPINLRIIKNTLVLGFSTVLVCGAVGVSLAFYMTYRCRHMRNVIHVLLLLPIMIPGTIIVIAFKQMYGESGTFTTILKLLFQLKDAPYQFRGFPGILYVHLCTQYVLFYIQTYTALKYVDYAEIEVARGLGASKFQIFKDIILPAIRPSLIMSASMTFITGISSFAAPNIIGDNYKVLSIQIAMAKSLFNFQLASIASTVLFVIGLLSLGVMMYSSRKNRARRSLKATQYKMPKKTKLTWQIVLEHLCVGILLIMIFFPIFSIIYMSFVTTNSIMSQPVPHDFTLANYLSVIHSRRTVRPFFNSLRMSLMTVVGGLIMTVPLAYIVSRTKSRLSRLAWFFVTLSWSMSGSVLAVNLISAFNHPNIFSFGVPLIGGTWILPIAYTIHALPVLMNNNMVAMESFNSTLEDASHGLGANKLQTMFKVVLPCVVPGIAAGSVLTIITTMGEYTVSTLLYGVHNMPISITMLNRFSNYHIGDSMAYAVVVIAFCGILFSAVMYLDKDRRL